MQSDPAQSRRERLARAIRAEWYMDDEMTRQIADTVIASDAAAGDDPDALRQDLDDARSGWEACAETLRQTETERDEADRRAGAAERRNADLQDSANCRADWLSRAKRQWGVLDDTSFDVVWAECLSIKAERDALAARLAGACDEILVLRMTRARAFRALAAVPAEVLSITEHAPVYATALEYVEAGPAPASPTLADPNPRAEAMLRVVEAARLYRGNGCAGLDDALRALDGEATNG